MQNKFDITIDKYVEDTWDEITKDIKSLIQIPSFRNEKDISPEYPSGIYPAKAMETALSIAERFGFKTKNHKNIIGIADLDGKSKTQLGVIGHCDVVNAGPGWRFDPYNLTIKNGYMIGRGVIDDKGPIVLFLYAINFWIKQSCEFPYSIRFLFGTDEEDNSNDVAVYKQDFPEPKVVITPDSDFPICYGEKGLTRFRIVSDKIINGQIIELNGGTSINAMAGRAYAIVKTAPGRWIHKTKSRLAHAIDVSEVDTDTFKITAKGRSTHAATPYEGIDSIAVLTQFLLEKEIGNKQEYDFLKFISRIAGKPNGEGIGLDYSDKYFDKLTIVPTKIQLIDNHLCQIFDVRYPACITIDKIKSKIKRVMPPNGTMDFFKNTSPLLINPNSTLVNALADAYTEATGEKAKKFTMGGASYARDFKCATSYGPLMPWKSNPAWVGTLHAPDEGVKIDVLKESLKIYIYAIKNLMELDLDSENFIKDTMTIA